MNEEDVLYFGDTNKSWFCENEMDHDEKKLKFIAL